MPATSSTLWNMQHNTVGSVCASYQSMTSMQRMLESRMYTRFLVQISHTRRMLASASVTRLPSSVTRWP